MKPYRCFAFAKDLPVVTPVDTEAIGHYRSEADVLLYEDSAHNLYVGPEGGPFAILGISYGYDRFEKDAEILQDPDIDLAEIKRDWTVKWLDIPDLLVLPSVRLVAQCSPYGEVTVWGDSLTYSKPPSANALFYLGLTRFDE